VFLTGATGFLGAFLLERLLRDGAEVMALVRAPSDDAACARMSATFAEYGIEDGGLLERLEPVRGDLRDPLFGLGETAFAKLAARVDLVVHNGAQVSFALPYASLSEANVRGTETAIRLAAAGGAPLHHVSSLAVFEPGDFGAVLKEGPPTSTPERLSNAYAQTKWVAECLVAEAGRRGLDVAIYRPGGVAGHSASGAFNRSDLMVQGIRACAALGAAPDVPMSIDMTPVDYVAGAIAWLARHGGSGTYHLANPRPLAIGDLAAGMRALGYPVDLVPLAAWRARLRELVGRVPGAPFAELLPLASRDPDPARPWQPRFECSRAVAALMDSPVAPCPPADALIPTYVDAFVKAGVLPAPPRGAGVEYP
jgi:thioester reductase-like protein